ncbi:MAG: ATP-binding protein [Deltaproteobacteria bacterium]|nr:ATP-binding protein [Deltaproteobacteria bacterium]
MIARDAYLAQARRLLRQFPVVGILGARQVGKTTLARQVAAAHSGPVAHYDLEDPDQLARLADPMLELRSRRGLIILDEIQRRPELFPALRVLADERPRRRRFLVLGSAAPHLLRQSSETLAGRVIFLELAPLSITEVPRARWAQLWLRGGFPSSFLARSDAESLRWRASFRQTFLERDVPALGLPYAPASATLGRFWAMLAHVHGELLNWSELGRSMGVSDVTARRYVDVLEGALVVRQLRPWHENLGKRQVKSPKLYFRDTGLLHTQLGLGTRSQLEHHPRVGASWEGFILEQVRALLHLGPDECWFWRTEHGAELDLLVTRGGRRWGFEVKRSTAPAMTRSMHSALADLKLDHLWVVHAGAATFPMAPKVTAVAAEELDERLLQERRLRR